MWQFVPHGVVFVQILLNLIILVELSKTGGYFQEWKYIGYAKVIRQMLYM